MLHECYHFKSYDLLVNLHALTKYKLHYDAKFYWIFCVQLNVVSSFQTKSAILKKNCDFFYYFIFDFLCIDLFNFIHSEKVSDSTSISVTKLYWFIAKSNNLAIQCYSQISLKLCQTCFYRCHLNVIYSNISLFQKLLLIIYDSILKLFKQKFF